MTSTDVTARLSPAYWRLWTASTISNLGDGVFLVALPLLASRLTRSELSISFIGVAAALPWLLLSLPIGALVDRIDHRLLMVRADVFRAVVVGALTIAVASHNAEIWMLWVAAGCLGVAEVFFDNASQAMVPSIVPIEAAREGQRAPVRGRDRRQQLRRHADRQRAVRRRDVAAVRIRCGVSFAIAALPRLHDPRRDDAASRADAETRRPLRVDIAEGLRWLSGNKVLRGLAIAASLSVLGMQMTAAIFVLFAQDLLHLSDRWYGALIAIGAIGAVGGGLVAERLTKRFGSVAIIYGTVVVWIAVHVRRGLLAAPVGQRDRDGGDGVRNDGLEHRHRLASPTHRAREPVRSRQQRLPLAGVGIDLDRRRAGRRRRQRVRLASPVLLRRGIGRDRVAHAVLLDLCARTLADAGNRPMASVGAVDDTPIATESDLYSFPDGRLLTHDQPPLAAHPDVVLLISARYV